MSGVAFLGLAVVVSVVGSVVLWLRTRKPTTLGSSIDSFEREMRALAPEWESPGAQSPSPQAPTPSAPGGGRGDGRSSAVRPLGDRELTPAPLESDRPVPPEPEATGDGGR